MLFDIIISLLKPKENIPIGPPHGFKVEEWSFIWRVWKISINLDIITCLVVLYIPIPKTIKHLIMIKLKLKEA